MALLHTGTIIRCCDLLPNSCIDEMNNFFIELELNYVLRWLGLVERMGDTRPAKTNVSGTTDGSLSIRLSEISLMDGVTKDLMELNVPKCIRITTRPRQMAYFNNGGQDRRGK